LKEWARPDVEPKVQAKLAKALGLIGDPRALPPLRQVALDHSADGAVREAALRALGDLDHPDSAAVLRQVLLEDDSAAVRAAAAAGLGKLTRPEAAGALLEKLQRVQVRSRRNMDTQVVRKELARAIGDHLGRRLAESTANREEVDRAVTLLLGGEGQRSLLQDAYLRVRNKAAVALGKLRDSRGIAPLTALLRDNDNPKLLQSAATALGELLGSLPDEVRNGSDGAEAVSELLRQLHESSNDSIREAAVRGLGLARAVGTAGALWEVLNPALRRDQEGLAEATAEALMKFDSAFEKRIDELRGQIGRTASQQRRLMVLDDAKPLEQRIAAARELGEYRDRRGRQALQRTADNAEAPEELRQVARETLERLR
jgi:HEAT repeat protein